MQHMISGFIYTEILDIIIFSHFQMTNKNFKILLSRFSYNENEASLKGFGKLEFFRLHL